MNTNIIIKKRDKSDYNQNDTQETVKKKILEIMCELKNNSRGEKFPGYYHVTEYISLLINGEKESVPVEFYLTYAENKTIDVEFKSGFIRIEGEIEKRGSNEKDVELVKKYEGFLGCHEDGVMSALKRTIGKKNEKYIPSVDLFDVFERDEETYWEYVNHEELDVMAENICHEDGFNRTIDYSDDPIFNEELNCGLSHLRIYKLQDLALTYSKEILLPVEYFTCPYDEWK